MKRKRMANINAMLMRRSSRRRERMERKEKKNWSFRTATRQSCPRTIQDSSEMLNKNRKEAKD